MGREIWVMAYKLLRGSLTVFVNDSTIVRVPAYFKSADLRQRAMLPNFPTVDLVADFTGPGEVLYWIEPNALGLAAIAASLTLIVPNMRLVRPPQWVPSLPAYQPAYLLSWQQACGIALLVVGGVIIVTTIVEDFATLGALAIDSRGQERGFNNTLE